MVSDRLAWTILIPFRVQTHRRRWPAFVNPRWLDPSAVFRTKVRVPGTDALTALIQGSYGLGNSASSPLICQAFRGERSSVRAVTSNVQLFLHSRFTRRLGP